MQKGNIKISAKSIAITGSIGKNSEEDTLKFDGTQIETGGYPIRHSNSGQLGLRINGEEYAYIGTYVKDTTNTFLVKNCLLNIQQSPRELRIIT